VLQPSLPAEEHMQADRRASHQRDRQWIAPAPIELWVKALIVASHFLETELEKARAAISTNYARGKLPSRDRIGTIEG
jgi:hypothetical protein